MIGLMAKTSKPKIALNMTTLDQGGVIQRAISFISHLDTALSEFEWHLLVSKKIDMQLKATSITTNSPISVFEKSPSKNFASRRLIADSISKIDPQMVYTFGGPSYLKQPYPELVGITDGWMTHADPETYRSVPRLRNRLGLKLTSWYKLKWCKRAIQFIVQTETAKRGLAARIKAELRQIHVIPNALADWYREVEYQQTEYRPTETLRIFYFAAAYSHKRHDLLPDVCRCLERLGLDNFEFLITLPKENPISKAVITRAEALGVAGRIRNLGQIPATEGVQLYRQCHVCFVPTVLETFSATYLEGMATQTPIVTSDREFSREICGEGASYFESSNAKSAAEKIYEVACNPKLRQKLIEEGLTRLEIFPDVGRQMELYEKILRTLLSSEDFPTQI